MESQKIDQNQTEESSEYTSEENKNTEVSEEQETESLEQTEEVSEQTEEVLEQAEQITEQTDESLEETQENFEQSEVRKEQTEHPERSRREQTTQQTNADKEFDNEFSEKTPQKTLSIKCSEAYLNMFRKEAQKFATQKEFFHELMQNYFNPPAPPVPEVKTVVQEKPVEVEKKLQAGEHLVKLSEAEEKTLGLISINRMHELGKKQPPGYGPVKAESFGEILRKSFFNRSRLFNFDNTFFTGLTKRDLK